MRGYRELSAAATPSWTLRLCPGQTLLVGSCLLRGAASVGPTGLDILNAAGSVVASDAWTKASRAAAASPPPGGAAPPPPPQSSAVTAFGNISISGLLPLNYPFNASALLNASAALSSAGRCSPVSGSYLSYSPPGNSTQSAPYTLRVTCRGRSATPDVTGAFYYPFQCSGTLIYSITGNVTACSAPPAAPSPSPSPPAPDRRAHV